MFGFCCRDQGNFSYSSFHSFNPCSILFSASLVSFIFSIIMLVAYYYVKIFIIFFSRPCAMAIGHGHGYAVEVFSVSKLMSVCALLMQNDQPLFSNDITCNFLHLN